MHVQLAGVNRLAGLSLQVLSRNKKQHWSKFLASSLQQLFAVDVDNLLGCNQYTEWYEVEADFFLAQTVNSLLRGEVLVRGLHRVKHLLNVVFNESNLSNLASLTDPFHIISSA